MSSLCRPSSPSSGSPCRPLPTSTTPSPNALRSIPTARCLTPCQGLGPCLRPASSSPSANGERHNMFHLQEQVKHGFWCVAILTTMPSHPVADAARGAPRSSTPSMILLHHVAVSTPPGASMRVTSRLWREDFAVACPLVPTVPHRVSGSCPSPRTFVPRFLQTPPRGDALALLLSLGSTDTWTGDFHPRA